MSKKVLLVFAGRKTNVPRLPMSCLALAAYIRERNYNPEIIDLRIDNKYKNIDFSSYLCIGISAESGVPLKSAIKISKYIKKNHPDIPIIWGSHHASCLPQETLSNPYVDCVVKGEGEKALLRVIKDIEEQGIKGCFNKIYEEKETMNVEELPIPAYDIINLNDYQDGLDYETSRGCPNRCGFCYVTEFHKSRCRNKSAEKVLKECEYLIKEYKIKHIRFAEDNFFTDKKRALEIAKGFIKNKFNITWNATIRLDYLSKCTQEELKIIKDSGIWMFAPGAESGNQKILAYITKDITIAQIRQSIRNCIDAGIKTQISLMAGFPIETKEDVLKTLDFYDELIAMDEKQVEINGIFLFTPFPGTRLYGEVIKNYNYKSPKTLEDWSEWRFNNLNNITWFKRSYRNYLQNISTISRFKFFENRIQLSNQEYIKNKFKLNTIKTLIFKFLLKFYAKSAEIRWKKRMFGFAPEWRIYDFIKDLITDLN